MARGQGLCLIRYILTISSVPVKENTGPVARDFLIFLSSWVPRFCLFGVPPLKLYRSFYMRTTKYDVLIITASIIKKSGGNWSYASRKATLKLLENIHNIKIRYRQLGNHLADLRQSGLIKSITRNHRRSDGTLCLLTSARCLTIKGCKYLIRHGVTWAKHHLNKLKLKYIPPAPGKPASSKVPTTPGQTPRKPGENPYEDPEFRKEHGLKPLPPWKVS